MKEFFELFAIFFRIGLFTFGGGYAMMPIARSELIVKRAWLTEQALMDAYAAAQCAPGIIMVNTAVLVGYGRRKLPGAIVCGIACVIPSLCIIMAISGLLANLTELVWLAHAFAGISVAVVALVAWAVVAMVKSGVKDALGIVLCVLTFALMTLVPGFSPVWCIVGAALVGVGARGLKRKSTPTALVCGGLFLALVAGYFFWPFSIQAPGGGAEGLTLWVLCLEFAKIGVFALGGGMAAYPFLQDMAMRHSWFSLEMLQQMVAVSESTPGPLGVNMATFVGFTAAGVWGSIVATFSMILPGMIIVCLMAITLKKFQKSHWIQDAFYGLRPAVAGLICQAGFKIAQNALLHWDTFTQTRQAAVLFDPKALGLFAVCMVCMGLPRLKKLHPSVYILFAGVVGLVLGMG